MNISNRKLKKSAEHVYYEISMLYFVTQNLAKNPVIYSHQYFLNLMIESMGIHIRNLLNFFYAPISKRYRDDILAEDFVSNLKHYKKNRTKLKKLGYIKKRVSKQLVHLTYHRNKYNKKTKSWNFNSIYLDIYPTIVAFYESLPKHRKKWSHFTELKKSVIDI